MQVLTMAFPPLRPSQHVSAVNPGTDTRAKLLAISPVDGRYAKDTAALKGVMSEFGLIRARVFVEVRWLRKLDDIGILRNGQKFSKETSEFLASLEDISLEDAERIKEIEKTTNHDVKAVEYFLKEKIASSKLVELSEVSEFLHFGCTSEDISNAAYALMLQQVVKNFVEPSICSLVEQLTELAEATAHMPLLSRTHGQPATPTTFGKEIVNFAMRLQRQVISGLHVWRPIVKFNGAVGNYNAHLVAFPDVNWPEEAKDFVERFLGCSFQAYSTQIECHDFISELCSCLARVNTIVADLAVDMWLYISRDLLHLKKVDGEVGSSTMPHKVNPIDFENAEGNAGMANCIFEFFSMKLPRSRLQRDLSDSTVMRNLGVAVAHTLLVFNSTKKGIGKIQVDELAMKKELQSHPEVLAEPIQTVFRAFGVDKPYEKLKEATRGRHPSVDDLRTLVRGQSAEVGGSVCVASSDRLIELVPETYIGYARKLTLDAVILLRGWDKQNKQVAQHEQ
eukprot:GHVT01061476.1.p2 GENE.GHVT01061476.1~~GHVT01061476.1.p2  ORF type:complete len:508 (+),score=70.49 GHVT01061476.1:6138-7661(+)